MQTTGSPNSGFRNARLKRLACTSHVVHFSLPKATCQNHLSDSAYEPARHFAGLSLLGRAKEHVQAHVIEQFVANIGKIAVGENSLSDGISLCRCHVKGYFTISIWSADLSGRMQRNM